MKTKQTVNQNTKKTHRKFFERRKKTEKNIDTRAGYGPTENFFSGRVRAPTPIL